MIVNGRTLSELYVQYNGMFKRGFDLVDPMWAQVATEVPSSTSENIYSWLGSSPSMRKWVGDRQVKTLGQHSYRLVNEKYELTIGVKRDDIEDNRAVDQNMVFQQMGASVALHPDEVVFPLLTNGRDADSVCYDGQPFFSASHPNGARGASTIANVDTGGSGPYWYLMALSGPVKPLLFQKRRDYSFKSFTDLKDPSVWQRDEFQFGVDARVVGGYGMWQQAYASNQALTASAIEDAWSTMRRYTSDEGQRLKWTRPTHLVIPTDLEFDAIRLLSQGQVLTSNSDGAASVDNIHRGRLKILITEQLPN